MDKDLYCRSCGCVMKLRRGKFGAFYGCSAYPHCKNIITLRDAALEDDPPTDWDTYGVGGDDDSNGDYD